LLFSHYYSSGTQVMINVTAHSDIFHSHLRNADMKYGMSYASVLLPQRSWQKASHKSNPLSVPWDIMDSYSTLPWVMWETVIVVEGKP
jgi:hypothetical protein